MTEAKSVRGLVDRSGTPGGPLAIALHGAVANRKTWLPLARELPPEFELWCPDLPGHGSRSSEPFTIAASLVLIDELVSEAGRRPIVLAGDSLGGYLALLAAASGNPRISAVCAGGCTWTMTGAWGVLARASDAPARLAERVLGGERLERFAAALLPRLTDRETADAVIADGFRTVARSESLAELRGVDLTACMRSIRVPITFVNGARDWPTRAGERSLVRAANDARVRLSPTSGHGVGFFDAKTFARSIAELLTLI